MADLIDRQAALEQQYLGYTRVSDTEWQKGYWEGVDSVCDNLRKLPVVDAVEVVRCKDCKSYENHKLKVYENCVRNERYIPMLPNDFCSYGERREKNAAD